MRLHGQHPIRRGRGQRTSQGQGDRTADQADQGQWHQTTPGQPHDLIDAQARQRPAQPDEEHHQADHLGAEDRDVDEHLDDRVLGDDPTFAEGRLVAAQEEHGKQRARQQHVDVLGHGEERPTHAGILGVESAHQFAVGFGEIERGAVALGQTADDEDHRSHEQQRTLEQVPAGQAENAVVELLRRDLAQTHAARPQHDDGDDQGDRDLVADDLRHRAHAAKQRPLVVRAPAGHDQADHHQAGDTADVDRADRQICHIEMLGERHHRERQKGSGHGQVRCGAEDQRISGGGDEVLLRDRLHSVGSQLDQPQATGQVEDPAESGQRRDLRCGRQAFFARQEEQQQCDDPIGTGIVGADPTLHRRRQLALHHRADAGDGDDHGRERDDDDDQHGCNGRQPAGEVQSGTEPERDVRRRLPEHAVAHRSTSGKTMSRLPITATISASINPGASFGMIATAVNDPVRMRMRYGILLPSLIR